MEHLKSRRFTIAMVVFIMQYISVCAAYYINPENILSFAIAQGVLTFTVLGYLFADTWRPSNFKEFK